MEEVVSQTPVIDIHTHLFAPEFGSLSLFGIDELLTYHYLVAEMFRATDVTPERFWRMHKTEQAGLIWQTLFVENTPLSEATRGVVTVLTAFGLDPAAPDLTPARASFRSQNIREHLDRVLEMACVSEVVMTNDPFDARKASLWESGAAVDRRFHAALRLNRLLNDWQHTALKLAPLGYRADVELGGKTASEVRRFLDQWIARMQQLYPAVSLLDDFKFPSSDTRPWHLKRILLACVATNVKLHGARPWHLKQRKTVAS